LRRDRANRSLWSPGVPGRVGDHDRAQRAHLLHAGLLSWPARQEPDGRDGRCISLPSLATAGSPGSTRPHHSKGLVTSKV
jgi:hypothetical protein